MAISRCHYHFSTAFTLHMVITRHDNFHSKLIRFFLSGIEKPRQKSNPVLLMIMSIVAMNLWQNQLRSECCYMSLFHCAKFEAKKTLTFTQLCFLVSSTYTHHTHNRNCICIEHFNSIVSHSLPLSLFQYRIRTGHNTEST